MKVVMHAALTPVFSLDGGATHAGVELRVEDSFTGAVRVYSSPLGEAFGPVFDTRAFPCLQ